MSKLPIVETQLEKIVGGGQALGTYPDGRKLFVWGGLPGETVKVQVTKKKSKLIEGRVTEVISTSPERVQPRDEASYLSTSPWQIMSLPAEQRYKAALIEEAFELHDIVLPDPIEVYTDGSRYGYRNKTEFSWYWDNEKNQLELAFFRRGSKGKIAVDGTSLAKDEINLLARQIRDTLRKKSVEARQMKALMIRCDADGNCVWQLYVKDKDNSYLTEEDAASLSAHGGEIIYSDPKSPASRITERLIQFGEVGLKDIITGTPFRYACESFFQVNLPVYNAALEDMSSWLNIPAATETLDLYSGVGTIGLTIGARLDQRVTLVESDEQAVREMKRNIASISVNATPVHATSEAALNHITKNSVVIVDPPRAGLHEKVIQRLKEVTPPRILYLSCNPVTQARDVALLAEKYGIRFHKGYNFFPCTPHIEHLVVLDLKA